MPDPWDDRDKVLRLRDRFAQLVAEKISGSEGTIPESVDYDIADDIASLIIEKSKD